MEIENEPRDEEKERKEALSEQRSVLAKQRTLMAKQRTFAAWMRTGLATITVGIGIIQLLGEEEPVAFIQVSGAGLVVTGIAILVVGLWSYRRTFRVLAKSEVESIPLWSITSITAAMILLSLLLLAVILL